MKLLSHKYKNQQHLERFFEDNVQKIKYAYALVIVAYKEAQDEHCQAISKFMGKKKNITTVGVVVDSGCMDDKLVIRDIFVTVILTRSAQIWALSAENSKIKDDFLSSYIGKDVQTALLFSSMPDISNKHLQNAFVGLNASVVGVKSFGDKAHNFVSLNGKKVKNGVVVVLFAGKTLEAEIYKNSALKPISKKLKVTKAENGYLYEIDGLSLLEAYKKMLGEEIIDENPMLVGCRFPLISQKSSKPLFIEEFSAKKVILKGDIEDSDMVQIGYASLKEKSLKSFELAKKINKNPPSAMLIFSDYTIKNILKNKTPLAIPGSLSDVCESVSFFGKSEFCSDEKQGTQELCHTGVTLALREEGDVQHIKPSKEIKIALTPTDAFVNIVEGGLKEQFEINAKLKKALNAQKIFISSISHDIRTPLNSIIGFLELLDCTDLDSEQKSYVQKSLTSSKHLLRLISDVLDVSKIEADQMEFFDSLFDYEDLLDEIKNIVSSRRTPTVKLEFETQKLDRYLISDPDRIKQILTNLLSNALKYTKKGEVRLKTEFKPISKNSVIARITVEDSGLGIPKERLEDIFKPFYQVKDSIPTSTGGTGLGLHICKNICHILGGDITCESELGKGSKFIVEIPLRLGKKTLKYVRRSKIEVTTDDGGFCNTKVLIAEDVEFNAELISAILQKRFKISNLFFAKDGFEAVNAIKKDKFDIVFMDIQMPRLDGFSAIRIVREFDKTTPIVVMSANAFKEDIAKALKLGANDYITKPIRSDKIAEVLLKYVGKQFCVPRIELKNIDKLKVKMQKQMFDYYKKTLGLAGEDAKTLYNLCLESIKKSLGVASQALVSGNLDDLYSGLHNLKGILGSTGLDNSFHQASALSIKAKEALNGIKSVVDEEFIENFEMLRSELNKLTEDLRSDDA